MRITRKQLQKIILETLQESPVESPDMQANAQMKAVDALEAYTHEWGNAMIADFDHADPVMSANPDSMVMWENQVQRAVSDLNDRVRQVEMEVMEALHDGIYHDEY
jgi:hypothetical protein